jgi:hypothetical protein
LTVAGHPLADQSEAGILVVRVKDSLDDDAPLPREDRGSSGMQKKGGRM